MRRKLLELDLHDPANATATATVRAACSRHRREDVRPTKPDIAALLTRYFAERNALPIAPAFGMPQGTRSAGEPVTVSYDPLRPDAAPSPPEGIENGVDEGIRTPDLQSHSLAL